MALITYEDKVALNINPDIPDFNKVNASDMNEIKQALNMLEPNMISARGSTITATTTTDNTFEKISLNILLNKVGDKLSFDSSTGEITIGQGVSYISVSAGATLQYQSGSQTHHGVVILKNGVVFSNIIRQVRFATASSNNYSDSSLNNVLIDVNPGDKIAMGVFNRIAGSTNAIYPVLSVKVIK